MNLLHRVQIQIRFLRKTPTQGFSVSASHLEVVVAAYPAVDSAMLNLTVNGVGACAAATSLVAVLEVIVVRAPIGSVVLNVAVSGVMASAANMIGTKQEFLELVVAVYSKVVHAMPNETAIGITTGATATMVAVLEVIVVRSPISSVVLNLAVSGVVASAANMIGTKEVLELVVAV